jgi:hypothetical protein
MATVLRPLPSLENLPARNCPEFDRFSVVLAPVDTSPNVPDKHWILSDGATATLPLKPASCGAATSRQSRQTTRLSVVSKRAFYRASFGFRGLSHGACHDCKAMADLLVLCASKQQLRYLPTDPALDVWGVSSVVSVQSPCANLYCKSCLESKYSQLYDTVVALRDWACPTCLDTCSCFVCARHRSARLSKVLNRA